METDKADSSCRGPAASLALTGADVPDVPPDDEDIKKLNSLISEITALFEELYEDPCCCTEPLADKHPEHDQLNAELEALDDILAALGKAYKLKKLDGATWSKQGA